MHKGSTTKKHKIIILLNGWKMRTKIRKDSRNLLIAMALGDGYVNKNNILVLSHSDKQLEYLRWKESKLNEVGIRTGKLTKYIYSTGPCPDAIQYIIRTNTYMFNGVLRRIFYRPKKNIANRKILNRLDTLGLAIWYMDDGSTNKKKRVDGSVRGITVRIHTCLDTKEDAQIVCDYFKDVWGIGFYPFIEHRKYYSVQCGTREGMKFLDLIAKHVTTCPSMRYKVQYDFMFGAYKNKMRLCSDDDVTKRGELISHSKRMNNLKR